MSSIDEQILRASKEIVVKFIELGRVSPNGFRDVFFNVYDTVKEAVNKPVPSTEPSDKDTP